MTALVDVATYRLLTGDSTSASGEVEAQLAVAQQLVEEELDRPLEEDERTERLRVDRDGRVWPRATPITDAGDLTVEGAALIGATPDDLAGPFATLPASGDLYSTVTYTGGFTDDTLPMTLKREIARAAYEQLHVGTARRRAATSVAVGDVRVGFESGSLVQPGAGVVDLSAAARRALRSYRKAAART